MWELDHKECWALKDWCFWTAGWKISWGSLGLQGGQTVNPKGNQSWILIGRTDAEAEAPLVWPPDVKNWLIGKAPDAGKGWRWEEKGTEGEKVRWHHQFKGHEFDQALRDGEGQGSLACCSPWSYKELDTTEQLNNKGVPWWLRR